MKLFLTLTILATILTSTKTQNVLLHQDKRILTGEMSGIVTDITGARIQGAKIIIEGKHTKYTLTTAEDGTYRTAIPSGTYRAKVISRGFCIAQREAFVVASSSSIVFDFILVVCPIVNKVIVTEGRYESETDSYQFPYREETFGIDSSRNQFKLVIQFGERQFIGNKTIEYTGFKSSITYSEGETLSRHLGASARYNLLTIHADKIRFSTKLQTLEAIGNAIILDGKKSIKAARIYVKFQTGEPIIEPSQ